MNDDYSFETFKAAGSSFDREFTSFLNRKSEESWGVESCSFCHDDKSKDTYASCIFKKR